LKKAGSTNKGLFGLGTLSVAFWGGVSKPNRAASYTARLGSGQEAGVGASPESHGRGVNGFLGVAVGRDVVEKTVGSREVVLSRGGLVGRQLADSGEDREI